MYRCLVVDFNNLVYTSFFNCVSRLGLKPEEVPEGYSDHVYFFKEKLDYVIRDSGFTNSSLIFALDQKPVHKYELFAKYKSKRKPIEFRPQPAVLKALENWPCQLIYSKNMEADDVIASYVHQINNAEIVVVTTDKDLWPLARHPNTQVFDHYSKRFISQEDLEKKFQISNFDQLKLCKTLWGDNSDAIPNAAPRMQKQLLPLIRMTNGTLEDFKIKYEAKKSELSKRCIEILDSNWNQIEVNYKLVTLNTGISIEAVNYPKTATV